MKKCIDCSYFLNCKEAEENKVECDKFIKMKLGEEKMEYRYMIWNDLKKEFQFPKICETTEKGATSCLFNFIGNDARKDRFQIKKVEKEEAKKIVKDLKQKYKVERIHQILSNLSLEEIWEIVRKNDMKRRNKK